MLVIDFFSINKIISNTPIRGNMVKKEGWFVFLLNKKKDKNINKKPKKNKLELGKKFLNFLAIKKVIEPIMNSQILEWNE